MTNEMLDDIKESWSNSKEYISLMEALTDHIDHDLLLMLPDAYSLSIGDKKELEEHLALFCRSRCIKQIKDIDPEIEAEFPSLYAPGNA